MIALLLVAICAAWTMISASIILYGIIIHDRECIVRGCCAMFVAILAWVIIAKEWVFLQ